MFGSNKLERLSHSGKAGAVLLTMLHSTVLNFKQILRFYLTTRFQNTLAYFVTVIIYLGNMFQWINTRGRSYKAFLASIFLLLLLLLPEWNTFQVLHFRVGPWPYPQTLH
jgi:hypothetical protein